MNIADALKESHMNEYDLSRVTNIGQKQILDYISGKKNINKAPLEVVATIAKALGIHAEDLVDPSRKAKVISINDKDRIKLFLKSVDMYKMIMEGVDTPPSIELSGCDQHTFASLITEGMLLRKYYSKDDVNVYEVSLVLRQMLPKDAEKEVIDAVDCLVNNIKKLGEKSLGLYLKENDEYYSDIDLLYKMLYGGVLHGNIDRLDSLEGIPLAARCSALYNSNYFRRKGVELLDCYLRNAIDEALINID